ARRSVALRDAGDGGAVAPAREEVELQPVGGRAAGVGPGGRPGGRGSRSARGQCDAAGRLAARAGGRGVAAGAAGGVGGSPDGPLGEPRPLPLRRAEARAPAKWAAGEPMRTVFADTVYWSALINLRDQWRSAALQATKALGDVRMVTTQEVLTEVLN